MSTLQTPSLLDPTEVEVDPLHNGSYMRLACGLESVVNVMGFAVIFFYPQQVLEMCVTSKSEITATSILLVRIIGILILAFTAQLLFVMPSNRRMSIESRPVAYLTFLSAEWALMPFLLYQSLQSVTGIKPAVLQLVTICGFGPFTAWRFYSLFVNPGIMGRYKTRGKQM